MEEKSGNDLSLSMSGWKLKQEGLKNQRNYRQLQNRMVILELEKQGKIKSIEKKLQAHKKLMEIRMDRYHLKQSLQNKDRGVEDKACNDSRLFRDIRMNRTSNIRYRSNYMRETNHLVFRQIKNQREENEKNIKIEYERELKIKNSKRNKVRMIEIECKENINKFWIKKLTNFKDVREKEIARNLQNEERKMQSLMNLERSEANLLSEIKRTEQMETQLMSMMTEERSIINTTICHKA